MKRLLTILALTVIIACNPSDSAGTFDSEQLRGRYRVDLTNVMTFVNKSKKEGTSETGLALGLAMISTMEIDLNFYENNQAVLHLEGGIFDMAAAFSKEKIDNTMQLNYKVESDSILYTKADTATTYKKLGILTKIGPSYDYLKLTITDKKTGETVSIGLNKQAE